MLRLIRAILAVFFTVLVVLTLPITLPLSWFYWRKYTHQVRVYSDYFNNTHGDGIGDIYKKENAVAFAEFWRAVCRST